MSGVAWGSRSISGVASNGVVTQLYPAGIPTTLTTPAIQSTNPSYPPAASGLVRRPRDGYIDTILFESDGVNGGYVELWDLAGLDRGADNNVNDGITVTDAYATANGMLIAKIQIQPSVSGNAPLASMTGRIPFNKGLAVRFVGSGVINVIPVIEGGFTCHTVVA